MVWFWCTYSFCHHSNRTTWTNRRFGVCVLCKQQVFFKRRRRHNKSRKLDTKTHTKRNKRKKETGFEWWSNTETDPKCAKQPKKEKKRKKAENKCQEKQNDTISGYFLWLTKALCSVRASSKAYVSQKYTVAYHTQCIVYGIPIFTHSACFGFR